ncbi:MAG: hypothetical protein FWD70_06535, partial [Desulfuromonadales bacterium]|nr:hypothetical protein [Desulfuromonadales bacterium]
MNITARRVIPILILSAIILLCFSRILFTEKIVRAPDIINEFYWTVKDTHHMSFSEVFPLHLKADWDPYTNSGTTTEGGWASQQFLVVKNLIFWLIPAPVSIAWFMVLNLIFGGIGTYLYCRLIGTSRTAAFLGGLIF